MRRDLAEFMLARTPGILPGWIRDIGPAAGPRGGRVARHRRRPGSRHRPLGPSHRRSVRRRDLSLPARALRGTGSSRSSRRRASWRRRCGSCSSSAAELERTYARRPAARRAPRRAPRRGVRRSASSTSPTSSSRAARSCSASRRRATAARSTTRPPASSARTHADGRVLDANTVAERLLRMPREALIGRPFTELLPPAERAAGDALRHDAIARGTARRDDLHLLVARRRARAGLRQRRRRSTTANRHWLLLICIDMSEQRRLEAQLDPVREDGGDRPARRPASRTSCAIRSRSS